jgi:hypothetical protein
MDRVSPGMMHGSDSPVQPSAVMMGQVEGLGALRNPVVAEEL